jgi:chromosome partitioning protein
MQILVTSLKGGVGKTTTSVHLAAFLAQVGSTLLVDADPAEGALVWARQSDHGLPFEVAAPGKAKTNDFEHVVIDTRGHPKNRTIREYGESSDLIIVPTNPGMLSLLGLEGFLAELEGLPVKVLVTLVPPLPSEDGFRAIEFLKEKDIPHFKNVIRRFAVYEKAVAKGKTVIGISDDKARAAWDDVLDLGLELLGG